MSRKIQNGFRAAKASDADLELILDALLEYETVLRYKAGLLPQGSERQMWMNKAQHANRIIEKIQINLEGEPNDER